MLPPVGRVVVVWRNMHHPIGVWGSTASFREYCLAAGWTLQFVDPCDDINLVQVEA